MASDVAGASGRRIGSLYDLTMGELPMAANSPPQIPHWLTHIVEDLSGPNAAMGLAHLVAAAVVGWWLASGEHAWWTLVCLVGSHVGQALAVSLARVFPFLAASPLRVGPPPAAPSGWWGSRPLALLKLATTVARRGPPVPRYI